MAVVLEALPDFLAMADQQLAKEAQRHFKKQGLDVYAPNIGAFRQHAQKVYLASDDANHDGPQVHRPLDGQRSGRASDEGPQPRLDLADEGLVDQAQEQGIEIDTLRQNLREVDRAILDHLERLAVREVLVPRRRSDGADGVSRISPPQNAASPTGRKKELPMSSTFAALGVPVLDGLGVKGAGAHTLEEFIFIDDIPKRATLLASLLLTE